MITAFKLRSGDTELEVVRVSGGFKFSDDFPVLHTKQSAIEKIVNLVCENDPHFNMAMKSHKGMFREQLDRSYRMVLNLMD